MKTVIGIDPGQHCGIACFTDGKLNNLLTCAPHKLLATLTEFTPAAVVFEDSRKQSHVWQAFDKRQANVLKSLKIARNLGMVDGICAQIEAWCEDSGVQCYAISPKSKGAKLSADDFSQVTGWTGRSNQHERDSAMVAWPFKNMQ